MEPRDNGGNSEHLLVKGVIILTKKLNQQNSSLLGWPFVCLLEIKRGHPLGNAEPPADCSALGPLILSCTEGWALGLGRSDVPFLLCYHQLWDLVGSYRFSFFPFSNSHCTDVLGTMLWARECRDDRNVLLPLKELTLRKQAPNPTANSVLWRVQVCARRDYSRGVCGGCHSL